MNQDATLDYLADEALADEVAASRLTAAPEWDDDLIFEITSARCPKST